MVRVSSGGAASSSMASTLKAYSIPLVLLAAAIFLQLFVIPNSFPLNHYDVLGIKRYSTVEEVAEAYEKFSSKWNSGTEVPETIDFIKIRYAFELLTDPLWKRDYDIFDIDEQIDVFENVKKQFSGVSFSGINLPLLSAASSDPGDHVFNVITSNDFHSVLEKTEPLLIQIYSLGSNSCRQFSNDWKRIATFLEGVANTGMVELGDARLAAYLAEKKPTGQPFFRNGLPSLVAFPSGCRTSDCLVRYEGELSVDAVTDWFATAILTLPRIPYYSKESLGQAFLAKSSPWKVKVIVFSRTGQRATPFLRQAAKNYWAHASFAFVLWQEEDSSVWWNTFEVESAPAIVFLKDPGVKPVVHHGFFNNSWFVNIMEQNKQQELPQLRSITSMELGCDARGYSRAGYDTMTWYCVILVGRLSLELNKMRETMRRVQQILSSAAELNGADKQQPSEPSAIALKEKRLTFTWLDGEAQKQYCFFYIHSEDSYDTCGPRRDVADVPQLFIVRYKRNATVDDLKVERRPKGIWNPFQEEDVDPASQLVARYNGSGEIPEIIKWISQIIKDGDSRDLPLFRTKTPQLVPEDGDPIWSKGAQSILSTSKGLKYRIKSIISGMNDRLGDPRIGPMLLLGSLMSFASIWLKRSQATHQSRLDQPSQPSNMDEDRKTRRNRKTTVSSQDRPTSITDMEPKDAYQAPLSDSDSD